MRKETWLSLAGSALMFHGLTTNAVGANVTLAWDRNSEPNISGYKVHYGSVNHPYPSFIDAGNASTQVINNLQEGVTYYFAVTAYDVDGQESDFSGEISYTVPLRGISAVGDGSFRVRFQGVPGLTYRIEYTESLTTPNWKSLGISEAGDQGLFEILDRPVAGSPMRFYRSLHPAR